MQTRNRFFDDAARVAGGAAGTFAGIKREVDALVRQQLERMLAGMDLVPREEFDAVREMAAKARDEQERLAERVAELEKALAEKKAPKKRKSTAKSA